MRTAIDTNVLSALWSAEETAPEIARKLGAAKSEGGMVVAAPVYAELLAYPKIKEQFVQSFLDDTGIEVEFELQRETWIEAARRFARYAQRRRGSAGGVDSKRLLADFLIGAHALVQADVFMTLDPTRYKRDFPELKLI